MTVGSLGQVMLDTVGPELQVVNKNETPISLEENGTVVLTPHQGQEASSSLLPINFSGLAKVNTCSCCFFVRSTILCSFAVFLLQCDQLQPLVDRSLLSYYTSFYYFLLYTLCYHDVLQLLCCFYNHKELKGNFIPCRL